MKRRRPSVIVLDDVVSKSGTTPAMEISSPLPTRYPSNLFICPDTANTRKRVLLIHTGGTLGMIKTQSGFFAPDPDFIKNIFSELPECSCSSMPMIEVRVFPEALDSADFSYAEYLLIAQYIAQAYDEFDGFVITHGTDTMAYSATALSFLLRNLAKPVVFTGSQIPLSVVRSDGKINLTDSLLVAAHSNIPEVVICFNRMILRGNRARKASNWDIDAFDSPNHPPLGQCGLHITLNPRRLLDSPTIPLDVWEKMESSVGVLRVHPSISESQCHAFLSTLKGVVVEAYGSGNIPTRNPVLIDALRDACQRGVVIVVVSLCPRGIVSLDRYESGSILRSIGCCSGGDMTPEAALLKLSVLLSMGLSPEVVREKMESDICGELTEDTPDISLKGRRHQLIV